MSPQEISYQFSPTNQGYFFEIYFPKRAAYYGTVFDALRLGYEQERVKTYLQRDVTKLLSEFKLLPDLFNPYRYAEKQIRQKPVSEQEALERIKVYQSNFKGWSTYTVDGVWFNEEKESPDYGKPFEEATQVVRIMFRFESLFTQQARDADCFDVLRAILFWLSVRVRLANHKRWDEAEEKRFIADHKPWQKKKLAFVRRYFTAIAKEFDKWSNDNVLFTFAYLIRQFWKEGVVKQDMIEHVIWATSFYDLFINEVKRIKL